MHLNFFIRNVERILNLFLKIRTKRILSYLKEGDFIFFDHSTDSATFYFLEELIKKKKVKKISLPHGLVFVRNFTIPGIESSRDENKLDLSDAIIYTTDNAVGVDGFEVGEEKISVLGSMRYKNSWIKKLESIYPVLDLGKGEKRFSVLVLAHKEYGYLYGKERPFIHSDKVKEILNFLSENRFISLNIKHHPNKQDSTLNFKEDPYFIDNANNFFDSSISTFQLVRACDLVVSLTSSAIMDAIILKKYIAITQFASPLSTIFEDYFPEYCFYELSSFKDYVNSLIHEKPAINLESYEKIYSNVVEPTGDPEDKYFDFINRF